MNKKNELKVGETIQLGNKTIAIYKKKDNYVFLKDENGRRLGRYMLDKNGDLKIFKLKNKIFYVSSIDRDFIHLKNENGNNLGWFYLKKDGTLKTLKLGNKEVYITGKISDATGKKEKILRVKLTEIKNKKSKVLGRYVTNENGTLKSLKLGNKKVYISDITKNIVTLKDENGKEIGEFEIYKNGKILYNGRFYKID